MKARYYTLHLKGAAVPKMVSLGGGITTFFLNKTPVISLKYFKIAININFNFIYLGMRNCFRRKQKTREDSPLFLMQWELFLNRTDPTSLVWN